MDNMKLLIYLASMAVPSWSQQMISCTKTGPCSCSSDKGTIDLSPLDSKDHNKPRFHDVVGLSMYKYVYSYNPCSPYTQRGGSGINGKCENIAACFDDSGYYLYALGGQESAKFYTDPKTGLEIQYEGKSSDSVKRTARVRLYCDPNQEANLTAPGAGGPNMPDGSYAYIMILRSKYCCPASRSISAGTVLCILFVVGVVLYLVVGMIYNKVRRGADGINMVPHLEFWKGFPGTVKEGACFVVGCCRAKLSYEKF